MTEPAGFDTGEFSRIILVRGKPPGARYLRWYAEALRFVSLQEDALAACVLDDVLERNPVRHRQNHFVAVLDQYLNGIEQHMLATDRNYSLFAAVVGVKVHRMTVHHRIAQFSRARRRRVLGEIFMNGGDGRFLNVLRRREMRLADAEVYDVHALLAQLVGLGYHRHSGGGLYAANAFGKFCDGYRFY